MGWGTTVKCKIQYPYKRFKDVDDIKKEQSIIAWKLQKLWSTVARYVKTNPKDYVAEHSNNQWNTYEATLESISNIIKDAKDEINELTQQDKVLEMLVVAENDNRVYHRSEYKSIFRLGYYGKHHWYTDILETIGCPVAEYGTEITDYVYNSRETYHSMDEIDTALDDAKNSLEMWWKKIENYAIQNPESYIQSSDVEGSAEEEVFHSYSEVQFFLNQEFDEMKELIEEENWKIAKCKQFLKHPEVGQKYFEHIKAKEDKEQEFKDRQKAVEDAYLKERGYTTETLFRAPNWQKLTEEVQNALEDAHLTDSYNPVKWEHEADDEIDYDAVGYIAIES